MMRSCLAKRTWTLVSSSIGRSIFYHILTLQEGLISASLTPRESVGLFFVVKGGGAKQRLIVDNRRSNAWFKDPADVSLLTGEDFARIEVEVMDARNPAQSQEAPRDVVICLGLTDVRGCVHRCIAPHWMQDLFCWKHDPVVYPAWYRYHGLHLVALLWPRDEPATGD